MPGPVAAQILTSMKIIMGEDGTNEGESHLGNLTHKLLEHYVCVCVCVHVFVFVIAFNIHLSKPLHLSWHYIA